MSSRSPASLHGPLLSESDLICNERYSRECARVSTESLNEKMLYAPATGPTALCVPLFVRSFDLSLCFIYFKKSHEFHMDYIIYFIFFFFLFIFGFISTSSFISFSIRMHAVDGKVPGLKSTAWQVRGGMKIFVHGDDDKSEEITIFTILMRVFVYDFKTRER